MHQLQGILMIKDLIRWLFNLERPKKIESLTVSIFVLEGSCIR